MKLAEAIIKSLESFAKPTAANDIGKYILDNHLWDTKGLTPLATIQARLGDFIREGDNRVKRIKENGVYFYYLAKNEQDIKQVVIVKDINTDKKKKTVVNSYHERDLHILLATYLK
ncbi:MAG: winged helix-turn-helix domain-containing protein, partial [Bacteroidales bacterium]|nr:winged helix-turn-helix domain-containing protein [Bacteroidales bacterium]